MDEFLKALELADQTLHTDVKRFWLYHDNEGKPLFYSTEEHDGNRIEVDKQIYSEGRYDLVVLDGKIKFINRFTQFNKLVPVLDDDTDVSDLTSVHPNNMMLVDNTSSFYWRIKTYYRE